MAGQGGAGAETTCKDQRESAALAVNLLRNTLMHTQGSTLAAAAPRRVVPCQSSSSLPQAAAAAGRQPARRQQLCEPAPWGPVCAMRTCDAWRLGLECRQVHAQHLGLLVKSVTRQPLAHKLLRQRRVGGCRQRERGEKGGGDRQTDSSSSDSSTEMHERHRSTGRQVRKAEAKARVFHDGWFQCACVHGFNVATRALLDCTAPMLLKKSWRLLVTAEQRADQC